MKKKTRFAFNAYLQQLARLNVPLLVRHADTWQQVPAVLSDLCQRLQIRAVHLNEEYGVHESRRDQACREHLAQQDVALHSHLDSCSSPPAAQ